MTKWKAIVFDLDNTLFSHEKAFKKAIKECFHTYQQKHVPENKQIDDQKFFSVFKYYSDYFWDKFEHGEVTGNEYRRMRFNETMKELNLPYNNEMADRFHSHYYRVVDEFSVPFEGVHELLQTVNDHHVKMAIITNGTVDTQYKKVEKIGVDKWIERSAILVSEEVGFAKPRKEIFLAAERALGVTSKDILFIGDSWKHDVIGAIEAGWDAAFLNSRREDRSSSHQPVCEYTHFQDMKKEIINLMIEGS
ncbi:HAD family hydrolase [Salipaludibacillus keqinensis]|nr:HAD family hydrolase [Salipaludibacillus keqinensis]